MGLGRHRLQAVGLALSLRPDLGLAEVQNPPAPAVKRRQKRSEADERRGAYVIAKIRQIEYELGIITGLSRGFEQRRARADGADAPVRLDFELRNEGKHPEWAPATDLSDCFDGLPPTIVE